MGSEMCIRDRCALGRQRGSNDALVCRYVMRLPSAALCLRLVELLGQLVEIHQLVQIPPTSPASSAAERPQPSVHEVGGAPAADGVGVSSSRVLDPMATEASVAPGVEPSGSLLGAPPCAETPADAPAPEPAPAERAVGSEEPEEAKESEMQPQESRGLGDVYKRQVCAGTPARLE